MRNAVFFMCYNRTPEQLALSKQALDSVLAQDIGPMDVYIVNNGSTQETKEWMDGLCPLGCPTIGQHWIYRIHYEVNQSPIQVGNRILARIFSGTVADRSGKEAYDKILGVPNDVILPPNCYSELAKFPRGFVSATPVEDCPQFVPEVHPGRAISTNTPMAVMLVRKWAWQAIMAKDGYFFDEQYYHWASDCDLALRMASCGIVGVQTDITFWHYRSASWRLAPPGEGRKMTAGADADREKFRAKWNFSVTDPKYGESAADINFKG